MVQWPRTVENVPSNILCGLKGRSVPQVNPPMRSRVLDTALEALDQLRVDLICKRIVREKQCCQF